MEAEAKAQQRLAAENMDLVWYCIRRFKPQARLIPELYSTGLLALVRASKAYNPTLGYKFSTYACRCILREFKHYLKKNMRYVTNYSNEKGEPIEVVYDDEAMRHPKTPVIEIQFIYLTDYQKELINDFYVRKKTGRQIAAEQGCSHQNISAKLQKIKELIRQELLDRGESTREAKAESPRGKGISPPDEVDER